MNYGTCSNCKWSEVYNWTIIMQSSNNFDTEGRLHCRKMHTENGTPEQPPTLARALDHEDYEAHVFVEPNFGCMMWEEKTG